MVVPETAERSIEAQRKALPDAPGVYLFKDRRGSVFYVGQGEVDPQAGRLALQQPVQPRRRRDARSEIDAIDFVVTESEAEALLAEQNFIKRHRPRFNIRLRDDKSYPYIAISLDEDYPRVYFTREKHRGEPRLLRPVLEREARARDARPARQDLPVPQLRGHGAGTRRRAARASTTSSSAARRPCVGYVSKEEYRENIDTIIAFLSGRYRQIERELEESMKLASDDQEFEVAALFRNRLRAVRSLLERQRITNESVGTLDAIAVAAEETDANAQVFQVRDGVLADRQSFYLENRAGRDEAEVLEEFVLQYYASSMSIPPRVVVPRSSTPTQCALLAEALAERRGGPVEVKSGRARRQAPDLRARRAQRAPRARPGPPALASAAAPSGSRRSRACARR